MSTDFYMTLINRGLYDLAIEGRDTTYANESPSRCMYEVVNVCNRYYGKTFNHNKYTLRTDYDIMSVTGASISEYVGDYVIDKARYVYIYFQLCDLSYGNEDSNGLIFSLYDLFHMKPFDDNVKKGILDIYNQTVFPDSYYSSLETEAVIDDAIESMGNHEKFVYFRCD